MFTSFIIMVESLYTYQWSHTITVCVATSHCCVIQINLFTDFIGVMLILKRQAGSRLWGNWVLLSLISGWVQPITSTERKRDDFSLLFLQTTKENPNGEKEKVFLNVIFIRFSLRFRRCLWKNCSWKLKKEEELKGLKCVSGLFQMFECEDLVVDSFLFGLAS